LDAELWIAGRRNTSMRIGNTPNIKLLGQVNNVRDLYKKADVFILPSLFESSAKVLYEAAASGLPIITTWNSGPFFKDRICGMIIPTKDYKAIKYAVQHFIEHPMHTRDWGKTAHMIVKDYTWENYGNKINDFYEYLK